MKYNLSQFFILLISLFCFSASAQAADQYSFDPEHSYVEWNINHLGFSTQTGKWFVEGSLLLDPDKAENSQVKISIKVASMVTGIDELNKHLSSALFFDTAQFSLASFVSTKVKLTGKNTALVDGLLTLHGISKPITLKVTLNKLAPNLLSNKMTAGFTATTQLKRSDFGITAFLPEVGDEVGITIGAEANKI